MALRRRELCILAAEVATAPNHRRMWPTGFGRRPEFARRQMALGRGGANPQNGATSSDSRVAEATTA